MFVRIRAPLSEEHLSEVGTLQDVRDGFNRSLVLGADVRSHVRRP